MKVLGQYTNGNYLVTLYQDGTKIRQNDLDNFTPAFAESIDVKITNKCLQGCHFCYESSRTNGKHADLLDQNWIKSLHPYTEIAINGNDLDHPQLDEFLKLMQERHVIVSMTVKDKQFYDHMGQILSYIMSKRIYGLGVSLSEFPQKPLRWITNYRNAVIHLINGVVSKELIEQHLDDWKKAKILILGYKNTGKGIKYQHDNFQMIHKNMQWLKENILSLIQDGVFKTVAFDNLAIKQLELEKQIKEHPESGFNWNELYMGNDGEYSFYIDAVEQQFALNSTISKTEHFPIENRTVDEMFNFLREHYEINKKATI